MKPAKVRASNEQKKIAKDSLDRMIEEMEAFLQSNDPVEANKRLSGWWSKNQQVVSENVDLQLSRQIDVNVKAPLPRFNSGNLTPEQRIQGMFDGTNAQRAERWRKHCKRKFQNISALLGDFKNRVDRLEEFCVERPENILDFLSEFAKTRVARFIGSAAFVITLLSLFLIAFFKATPIAHFVEGNKHTIGLMFCVLFLVLAALDREKWREWIIAFATNCLVIAVPPSINGTGAAPANGTGAAPASGTGAAPTSGTGTPPANGTATLPANDKRNNKKPLQSKNSRLPAR